MKFLIISLNTSKFLYVHLFIINILSYLLFLLEISSSSLNTVLLINTKQNANIDETNNKIALLSSNKIKNTSIKSVFVIVKIGLVNAKVKPSFNTSRFFIENLLIIKNKNGVIIPSKIKIPINNPFSTKLSNISVKNLIFE